MDFGAAFLLLSRDINYSRNDDAERRRREKSGRRTDVAFNKEEHKEQQRREPREQRVVGRGRGRAVLLLLPRGGGHRGGGGEFNCRNTALGQLFFVEEGTFFRSKRKRLEENESESNDFNVEGPIIL